MSSTPSHNLPIRHTAARHHSHSVSLGSVNPSHRVTRRKSMTSSTANNAAAIAAAIKVVDESPATGAMPSARRSFTMRSGGIRGGETASITNGAGSVVESLRGGDENMHDPAGGFAGMNDYADGGSVLDDENPNVANDGRLKSRARRASEGAHLSKSDGKRSSGGELRCEKCGKGYKHSSCLTKHLWEHTPEWTYTSKLLISKHQQVQLLEAASVLVGMNHDPSAPSEVPKTAESDQSSASPAASGSSELHEDEISSVETTPPPMHEQAYGHDGYGMGKSKRHSHNGSGFSRSYQSAPSSSLPHHLPPTGGSFATQFQPDFRRPSTSGISVTRSAMADEEDASLAAAVQSLCSFGTPRPGHVHLPADAPPVPPVPARFVEESNRMSGHFLPPPSQPDFGLQPPPLTHRISDERDVKMDGRGRATHEDDEEYDNRSMSHGRSDDDDDGIFGRMEE